MFFLQMEQVLEGIWLWTKGDNVCPGGARLGPWARKSWRPCGAILMVKSELRKKIRVQSERASSFCCK